jgi:hypothetical protein
MIELINTNLSTLELDRLHDHELGAMFESEAADGHVTVEVLEEIRRRVNEDSPRGFEWFYLLVRNVPLPRHGRRWVKELYSVRNRDGVARFVNEAFRGSTKTTIFTETFTAYQIGLYPYRSNLFIQASPTTAEEAASNVADIITDNAGWQMLFPHVVDDQEKGWGEKKGRWVKDTRYTKAEWQQMRHKNPTLLAGTYKGSTVVGKHPTGVFIFDDINDRKNTESERLNAEVNDIVKDTIFPMLEDSKWNIFNQTPWTKRDALQLVKDTGAWHHMKTPVLYINAEGEGEHIVVEREGVVIWDVWADLEWPEKFTVDLITTKFLEQGEKGFFRMYLLDLAAIEGMWLKREWLHDYPRDEVNRNWPCYIGVDYGSSADLIKSGRDPDYFSLTVTYKRPNGDFVVYDGFRGRLSQGEAEKKLVQYAMMHKSLQYIGIETDGSGREFYSLMARNTTLPLVECGTGGKSKGYRFEDIMAPYFQTARVWIAHPFTSWIHTFIDEWVSYDESKIYNDDTLDSTFYSLAPTGLFMEEAQPMNPVDLKKGQGSGAWYDEQEFDPGPFAAFGKQVRGR